MKKHFTQDFSALVRHFEKLSTHPKILVCLPPSLEDGSVKGPTPRLPRHGVMPRIVHVIRTMHLFGVNTFQAVAGNLKLFNGDHIHPNIQGQLLMAHVMYRALLKDHLVNIARH